VNPELPRSGEQERDRHMHWPAKLGSDGR